MNEQSRKESVMSTFRLGVKTWLAEVKGISRAQLGKFEISRLEKELEREYAMLGRIAEAPRGRMEEKEQSLKQIAFLKEEIATLRDEMAAKREENMKDVHKS